MSNPKLELFYYDSCPFCQMVMQVINQLSLDVDMLNILEDEANLSRLTGDTGRRTVPCLYIDDKPMFESRDIATWLMNNQENLKKK